MCAFKNNHELCICLELCPPCGRVWGILMWIKGKKKKLSFNHRVKASSYQI